MALYTTQIFIDDSVLASGGNPGWSFSNGWLHNDGYSFPSNVSLNQSVELSFSGMHVVIYGGGPTSYDWSLDGSPSITATPSGTDLDNSNEILFNSTVLSDSNHTLTFGNFTGNVTIDYALIAPGANTPVNTDTYIEIDDTDPAITYTGNWYQTTDPSRHNSITVGSLVEFGFCGDYTTFSGTFDPSLTGNITLGISIDNRTQSQQVYSSDDIAKTQFYYFWDTDLANDPSNCQHLVQIELISITGGQTFSFGSFYYEPSFTVFGQAPAITVVPSASASVTISTGSPSATSSSHASNATSGSSHSIIGPVVGGVVGGLVAIGILLGVLLFLRKRQGQRDINTEAQMAQQSKPSPFLETAPAGGQTTHYDGNEFQPYSNYSPSATSGTTSQLSPVRQSAAGGSSSYYNEKGGTTLAYVPPDLLAGPSDQQNRPRSISETEFSTAPSSSSGGRPDNVSRQMMEMMQSLQQRVEDLQRPPAYES